MITETIKDNNTLTTLYLGTVINNIENNNINNEGALKFGLLLSINNSLLILDISIVIVLARQE